MPADLDEVRVEIKEVKEIAEAIKSDWKKFLYFTVLGALLSRGPEGIAIIAKWLGIG